MTYGVITEYNPFHNGHKYQLDKIKEEFHAKNIVVIMSGDFVQRGDTALTDKFTRAKMALQNGADIVLEIPQIFATASAMYFSKASVNILNRLNFIDCLCFGSENTDVNTLNKISNILLNEPKEFSDKLKENLKQGFSYPKSRSNALSDFGFSEVISTPNNILGIEYIKALNELNSNIKPVTINRTNNFHDTKIENSIASATAIRENINNLDLVKTAIPENCFNLLEKEVSSNKYGLNNLSSIFHFILKTKPKEEILQIVDLNEQIYNRFLEISKTFYYISDISLKMKTKNLTQTRINRMIINIILDNKTKDLEKFTNEGFPFVRVLGFKKEKQHLLKELTEKSEIKILLNLKNANQILNDYELDLLNKDLTKSNLFLLSNNDNKLLNSSEYENKLVII